MSQPAEQLSYSDTSFDGGRHLNVVPKSAEAIDANGLVAEFTDDIEQKYVPASFEEAQDFVTTLRNADVALQEDVAAGRRQVDAELLETFHDRAEKGVDNWRLSHDERAKWAKISGMRSDKELDSEMRSFMNGLSPDSEKEASSVKFKRLVSQAHGRLKLDDEIAAQQEAEAAAPKKRNYEPGEVVAKLTKNGSRRVYQADERRKLRPMRQDDVLAYYEMEEQERGKPPKLTIVPKTTVDSAKSGTAKAEKRSRPLVNPDPEGIPQGVWDTELTDEEKRLAIKTVKEQQRRTAELEAYSKPWKDLTEEQRDIIFENMKKRREEADVTEPVTDTEPQGLRARVRRMMQQAHARLTTYTTKTFEYYQDDERGKRRKIVSGVVGALAAAGTVALLYKLGTAPSGSGNHQQFANGSGILDGGKGHPFGAGSVTGGAGPAELGGFNTGTVIDKAGKAHEAWKIHTGDRPWDVMARAGIPHGEIMHKLDEAARKSGLPYEWHGSGTHQWLELDGESNTASVMKHLGAFIEQ